MVEKTKAPWHDNRLFPPYAFMHVKDGREERIRYNSFLNRGEVTVAMALYAGLKRQLKVGVDTMPSIGVISSYSGQYVLYRSIVVLAEERVTGLPK